MNLEADVVIVGAGTSGAVAALNLARFRRVLIVERRDVPTGRIGESLIPAARRLLLDMGLWEGFVADQHCPWYSARSTWGSDQPDVRDAISNLDGHGWQLDRRKFDQRLRDMALSRGAAMLCPATVTRAAYSDDMWQISVRTQSHVLLVHSRLLIDCGGRNSNLNRWLRATRKPLDRLICCWIYGNLPNSEARRGETYAEATSEGWWYTTVLPDDRRILAWHTDADLLDSELSGSRRGFVDRAMSCAGLAAEISECDFNLDAPPQVTSAHSAILQPATGPQWLAAGDAALSFDPLSSQGLFNALYTGLAAAETSERRLEDGSHTFADYARRISEIAEEYKRNLNSVYQLEQRWPEHEFWRRRHR